MNTLLLQYGLTRGKLVVIAGLLVLLAGVWANALLGGGDSAQTVSRLPPSEPAAPPSSQPKKEPATAKAATPEPRTITLPPATVTSVSANDPFRKPSWAQDGNPGTAEPVVSLSEREAMLEQLLSEGVSIVVLSDNKKIAMVGGRQVRPDDVLAGHRVLDITAAGVVLSPTPIDQDAR